LLPGVDSLCETVAMLKKIALGATLRPFLAVAVAFAMFASLIGCQRAPIAQQSLKESVPARDAAAGYEIVIDNFTFSPAKLTIPRGATVHWVNRDDVPHTVTSSTRPRELDSGALDTDDRSSHQFNTVGTFDYFCAVHPHMTGQIEVK
jgi:plastocyanin